MRAPAKFLFDVDFAHGTQARPAEPGISPAEHALKLAEAEAAGFRDGAAKAKADADSRSAAAFERMAGAFEALGSTLGGVEGRIEAEAVAIAVAVARKLAPALIEREPFAEVEALAADCFRQLVASPHVVVRVNDALYDIAREKLDPLARSHGFQGRLVVLAEPALGADDCSVEWADGGIGRTRGAIEAAIAAAVQRYTAGIRGADAIAAARPAPANGAPPAPSQDLLGRIEL